MPRPAPYPFHRAGDAFVEPYELLDGAVTPGDGGLEGMDTMHDPAARWLGAYRRLPAPPPACPETRLALHRPVAPVVSPARRRANGGRALRFPRRGSELVQD